MQPSEIASFFILLATAGNDTTRTAISHGMDLLSKNPDQRRLWQADVEGVTASAVDEIVRASSPVTFMRRTATRDVTVSGHDFHDGDKVVMFYGAANRDPRVFDDPEVFDVRRNPNPHVGFGGPGPHFCLGAHLARREVAVVFRELFRRLPDIEVTGPVGAAAIRRHTARRRPQAPAGHVHADRSGRRLTQRNSPRHLGDRGRRASQPHSVGNRVLRVEQALTCDFTRFRV